MMLVYIAGCYNSKDGYNGIEKNIREAEKYAIELANNEIGFICPHLNSNHFEVKAKANEDFYYKQDIELLKCCDAMLVIPGWKNSIGVKKEIKYAKKCGIVVYYIESVNGIKKLKNYIL